MAFSMAPGTTKTFDVRLVDILNGPQEYPEGTTFSALSMQPDVATVSISEDGKTLTVTTKAEVTGNVEVQVFANVPGSDSTGAVGCFMIHSNADYNVTEWLSITPSQN